MFASLVDLPLLVCKRCRRGQEKSWREERRIPWTVGVLSLPGGDHKSHGTCLSFYPKSGEATPQNKLKGVVGHKNTLTWLYPMSHTCSMKHLHYWNGITILFIK